MGQGMSCVPYFIPWFHSGLLLPTRSHTKREALHGEGVNCCLWMGRLGIGLDWIGLGVSLAGWEGQKRGDWLAMLDAKGFPFGESYGERLGYCTPLVPQ